MARISTYETDNDINELDLLVGSERYIDSGVVKFRTKNYKVGDLATFFGISVGAVNTYLGSFSDDGSFSYSSAFATKITTTTAAQGFAAATDVTALTATVTTNKNSADASFTTVNQSIATETSARSSAVTTLTSSVNLKPNIFRQTSVPTALAPRDIWFDTDDGNRMYVATAAGDDQVTSGEWEETTDTRLAAVVTSAATATTNITTLTNADTAKAAQITELNAQFTFSGGDITGVADALNTSINTAVSNGTSAISVSVDELKTQFTFDGNNITGVADALNTSINTASSNAVAATATSLDKLEALFTFDGSNNVNGLAGGTTISSSIATSETNAISTANKASATREDNLSASVGQLFEQTSQPTVTAAATGSATLSGSHTATNSLAHNAVTGSRVLGQTVTGTGISGDVVIIELTDANNIVISSPQTLSSGVTLNFAKPQSPPDGSVWYDTTATNRSVTDTSNNTTTTSVPKNELYILKSGSWVASPDATMPTQASVNTVSSATATINGKLSARYGIKVATGNVFAGMELMSRADNLNPTGSGNVSDIVFTATNFKIKTIDGSGVVSPVAPFIVSGANGSNVITINGTLKIGTGTSLNDVESKANSATQASDYGTIRSVAAATSGNVAGWNISQYNINSGASANTTQNISGYSGSAGIIMNSNGSFHSPNFFINTDGSAGFKGTLTVGSTDLTTSNTLNENTTKDNVGLGNVDDTSDATVLGNAATAANTADKTEGTVGGWTINSQSIFSGTEDTSEYTTGGITIHSGGSIHSKNFYIDTSGNAFFKGDVTGASGTFSGDITGASGTIGGWTIGTSSFQSSDTLFTIDSTNNAITLSNASGPQIEITSSSTVSDPSSAGNSTAMTASSANSEAHSLSGNGFFTAGATDLNVSHTQVTGLNGRTITITATISGVIINNSAAPTGSTSAEVGFRVRGGTQTYNVTTILATSALSTVTSSSSGDTSVSTVTRTVSVNVTSDPFYIEVRPFVNSATLVNYQQASVTASIKYPVTSSVSFIYAPQKVEISQGGFLVSKNENNFLIADRNVSSSSSWSNNFLHTKMYAWRHEGRLSVFDGTGTGDIVVGKSSPDGNEDYIRVHSTAADKYIDYAGGNLRFRSGLTERMRLTSSGALSTSTGSLGTLSDSRLKENITDCTSKLQDILSLRVVNYEIKDDNDNGKMIGFVAQELETVFPSLVEKTDTREYDEDNNVTSGYEDQRSVKTDMTFAFFTKAIQEQQTIIESQKTLIEDLTARVTALEG